MLDRFIVGTVTRISPEAPVPVVRFRSEYVAPRRRRERAAQSRRAGRHGGARRARRQRRRGQARARPAGRGSAQRRAAWSRTQPAHGREGPDRDRAQPAGGACRLRGGRRRRRRRASGSWSIGSSGSGTDAAVVLVSDYLKGVVTRELMRAVRGARGRHGAPLLVDPKIPHLDYYAGATLVTPNHHEAEIGHASGGSGPTRTRRLPRSSSGDARDASAVLITRGEHGMWLSSPGGRGGHPGPRARGVGRHRRRRHGRRHAGAGAGRRGLAVRGGNPREPRGGHRRRTIRAGHA